MSESLPGQPADGCLDGVWASTSGAVCGQHDDAAGGDYADIASGPHDGAEPGAGAIAVEAVNAGTAAISAENMSQRGRTVGTV